MSWVLAIAEAHVQGVRWGHDLVFPYGPLGFMITGSAAHGWQFATAVAYRLGLIALLYGSAAEVARRSDRRALGTPMVIGLALLVGATNAPAELLIAAAFVRLFSAREGLRAADAAGDLRRVRELLWRSQVEASCLAALGLVAKFSVGVTLVVLAVAHLVAVVELTRRTAAGRTAIGVLVAGPFLGAAALIGFWLAAGQRLGDLPVYVRRSWALSSGYVQSMWLDNTSDRFGIIVAALAVVVVGAVVLRWRNAGQTRWRNAGPTRWWTEVIVLAPVLAVVFRASFTRQDSGHTFIFTGLAGLLCIPYLAASLRRSEWSVEALVLGTAAVVAVAQMGQSVSVVLDPAPRVRDVLGTIELLVRPGARTDLLREASAVFPESADVAGLLAGITGGPADRSPGSPSPRIAVIPLETSMIWRFRLRWSQPPVLQRYSAYTPGLDRLDASFLASKRAPAYVLYQSGRSIDGRLVAAEAPRSLLELTCRYKPVEARGTWTLLQHLDRSRCGRPTILRSRSVHNGRVTALDLPDAPPGTLIYALTLSTPQRSFVERLWTAILRPSREDTIMIGGERRRLIASSYGAPIPLTGPSGPGDALVSGIVGDVGPVPETLSISGPGWGAVVATISAYPAVDPVDGATG